MAERRYKTIFYGAVLVAAIATLGVYRVLQAARAGGRVATQPVVTAAQDVPEGVTLDRVALTVSQWPVPTVPAGAFASIDSVAGRVTRVSVFKGEPIVPGRLAPTGTGPGLEVKIGAGKRAMAVRINDVAGISGLIQPNSRVDVLVTFKEVTDDAKQVAKLFMENMRVLSVGTQVQRGEDGSAIKATTATLEVTPDEAERLAIALNQGSIQLVLRGYGDPDSIKTKGATSSDVLAQLRNGQTLTPAPVKKAAARPVRRPPPPRPEPVRVVSAPPVRPESLRVQVYRGGKATEQKFAKDSTTVSATDSATPR